MAPTKQADTKVVTGEVRLSYSHLLEAFSPNPGEQDASYSVTLLIPKSDKKTLKQLKTAQEAALEAGKSTKFGGKIPKNWHNTLRDGDEEADLERNPEYEGHYFMSVRSKNRPGVVDKQVRPITEPDKVYSGVYARASINAFAYSTSGNKGVSFGLNNVQILRDGDYLGGGSRAEDDFDEFESDDDDDDGEDDGLL